MPTCVDCKRFKPTPISRSTKKRKIRFDDPKVAKLTPGGGTCRRLNIKGVAGIHSTMSWSPVCLSFLPKVDKAKNSTR